TPETIVSVLQTFGRDEIINRMDLLNPKMKPPVSLASTAFFFHSKAFSLSFIPSSPSIISFTSVATWSRLTSLLTSILIPQVVQAYWQLVC
ncbi:hypothetical protein TorRG33x02_133330, partial [Trema orientale]